MSAKVYHSPGCLPLMEAKMPRRFALLLRLRQASFIGCAARYFRLRQSEQMVRPAIFFDLSFEEFSAFCALTGYDEKRGNGKFDLTIDREDVKQGYVFTNLKALTRIENTNKRNFVEYRRPQPSVGGGRPPLCHSELSL